MATIDKLVNQPSYVRPNYSSGDKAAAIFGNKWAMQNKQDEANFKNNLNMINYANDVNRQNMVDAPSLKVQGLTQAGINPIAAAGSVAGANLSPSGNNAPMGSTGDSQGIFDLLDRYVNNLTKIIKAVGGGGDDSGKAAQIAKMVK